MHADLSDLEDVRRLAAQIAESASGVSVLVNNAGVICRRKQLTSDGLEVTFAVNVVSPFLLARLLVPTLVRNAPGRVVNVSSDSHESARLDFKNLNAEQRFWPPLAYGQSKLALMLWNNELARRTNPALVTVNAVHPGFVATRLGNIGGVVEFGWSFMKPWGLAAREGARTSVYVACAPELAGVSGRYFFECKQKPMNPLAHDRELSQRLWSYLCRVSGVDEIKLDAPAR